VQEPMWLADPAGEHEYRYWDGAAWTEHVSDGGVASIAPLPDKALPEAAPEQVAPQQAAEPANVGIDLTATEQPVWPDDPSHAPEPALVGAPTGTETTEVLAAPVPKEVGSSLFARFAPDDKPIKVKGRLRNPAPLPPRPKEAPSVHDVPEETEGDVSFTAEAAPSPNGATALEGPDAATGTEYGEYGDFYEEAWIGGGVSVESGRRLGVASVVLAAIGLVFSFGFIYTLVVCLVAGTLAAVMGWYSQRVSQDVGQRGTLGLVGAVGGVAAVAVNVVMFVIYMAFFYGD
jgi:hypothetical protein